MACRWHTYCHSGLVMNEETTEYQLTDNQLIDSSGVFIYVDNEWCVIDITTGDYYAMTIH